MLTKNSIVEAVWASMSMPGLFPAIKNNNRWLVDGGLVNPVPVSTCRALGADIVIAVNLNGDLIGRHYRAALEKRNLENDSNNNSKLTELVKEYSNALFSNGDSDETAPGLLDSIVGSINITQDRITRSRLAGDPADILLTPKLADIGLLELYRADEAINAGKESVKRALPELTNMLENN